MKASGPKLVYVVTEDWYFVSHRLPLALAAKAAGYDVTVITKIGRHADVIRDSGFALEPIAFDRSRLNPVAELRTVAQLTSMYRRLNPDLVHHVAMKPVLYGSIAAWRAGILGIVNALMGLGYVFSSDQMKARLLRPVIRKAFRVAMENRNARVIVQNSDDAALILRERLAHASAIRLIVGSGVNLQQFPLSPEPSGLPRIVLPARLLREKGVFEFVDAARLLKEEGVEAEFVLAGAPDTSNPTSVSEDQIAAWVSKGILTYLGWCDDMPAVLAAATVVCLPSYREGLPKVLLEAAASGRAIVTTDVPGCREIIKPGVNGWVVASRNSSELANALREAIANKALRARFVQASRKMVEDHHSLETINRQTLAVYDEVLAQSRLSTAHVATWR